MQPHGVRQSAADEVDILLRRRDAAFRFLLKGVENVNHARELRRIDRAVGVRVVAVHDLHDARSAEALEGLGRRIGLAHLRGIERLTYIDADLSGKAPQIFPRRPYPYDRLQPTFHYMSI
jgi:hypothetical protein